MLSAMTLDARPGHRLRRARRHPARPRRGLPPELAVRLDAGLHHGRRHPADRLRLREEVDHKLGRLPLRYFDSHPRGDLLSRVTNDIDNIGQSLQQSLTQLITSLLTIVGVLVLMSRSARSWRHLAPGRAGVVRRDDPHRAPLAEPVRRPVGVDRRPQRSRRGDAHGPRDRQGVRPPARGDRDIRDRERAAVPGQLQGAVHLRDHPAGDELPPT